MNTTHHQHSGNPPITYLSARGLAELAGCSPQIVKSRLQSGDLIPAARLQNGTQLFTFSQAALLKRRSNKTKKLPQNETH